MARRRSGRLGRLAILAFAAGLAACGHSGARPDPADGALRLRFEDRLEPAIFAREGPAVRAGKGSAAGLWAAVRDLPRAERGVIVNATNRRSVEVALFPARPRDPDIGLSVEAAEALGIGDAPTPVRIAVLRRQPEIDSRVQP